MPETQTFPEAQPRQEQPRQENLTGPLAPIVIAFRTVAGVPSDKLVLIALIAVVGVLLYGFVWVIPSSHNEAIGVITNSNEQQRELDRKSRREEGDIERRERREQNERLRTTIASENEKTRETHTRDTDKLRMEFRQGIDEIKRTKAGGGLTPHSDEILGPAPPPRVKDGSAKGE